MEPHSDIDSFGHTLFFMYMGECTFSKFENKIKLQVSDTSDVCFTIHKDHDRSEKWDGRN